MGILQIKSQTEKELQDDFKTFVSQKTENEKKVQHKPAPKEELVLETCES